MKVTKPVKTAFGIGQAMPGHMVIAGSILRCLQTLMIGGILVSSIRL